MASPTEAEVQTIISNSIAILEDTLTEASNWVSNEDTLIQSLEGDGPIIQQITAAVRQARADFGSAIGASRAAAIIAGGLSLYARHVMNVPDISSPQIVLSRLYDHMVSNSLAITSRDFTFGSPAADGGNTGDGSILRLNVDSYGYDIENQHTDAKRAVCIRDGNSGVNRHEEEFEFRSQAPGVDALEVSGSNKTLPFRAKSRNQSLLNNASFEEFSGTAAAPTDITSWTSSVAVSDTLCDFDSTNYYRDYIGVGTPYALNLKLSTNLTQKLTVRGTKLRADIPYILQVAWNRQVGSASGTLLARMGAVNNSVVAAAQAGWQLLRVPATNGQNNWYRNFAEDELDIAIEWTRTGGEILIDDVMFVGADVFDGSWYWILGGATPWLATGEQGDFFTWSDSAVESVIQKWMWRAFGRYLPHGTGSAVTWVDPS